MTKKYRRDSKGDIILFNNIRVSKTSWVVIGIVVGVSAYFLIGLNFDQVYIPEKSFDECKSINFNDPMCIVDYKYCNTYADDKSICVFSETNPFTDKSQDTKYTEEEQDFLPPTKFILPFAYAVDDKTQKELNDNVTKLRKQLQTLQDELAKTEKDAMNWVIDEPVLLGKIATTERTLEQADEDFEIKKTAYRHAMDVKPRTDEDIQMQKDAKKEYDASAKKMADAQRDYTHAVAEHKKRKDAHFQAEEKIDELNEQLKSLLDEIALARISANISHKDNQFISIVNSQSCQRMIEHNVTSNCLTYRELASLFDNTVPSVSGKFVDLGYDIKRESPKYKNYWNYYKQLKAWKIITVDPDIEMVSRGAVIEVQSSGFEYVGEGDNFDKNASLDSTKYERYVWKDVKYTDKCSKAIVAPDPELITEAINHFLTKCVDTHEIKEIIPMSKTEIDITTSRHWQYDQWLKNAKAECKTKC